jgi:hypothetical protein
MPSGSQFERFFFNKQVAILFGFMALLTIMAIVIHRTDFDAYRLDHRETVILSICGASAAFGAFSLWAGMWIFWITCDDAPKKLRALWFFVLLIGLFYGAVLYYLLAYLPLVRRRVRIEGGTKHV